MGIIGNIKEETGLSGNGIRPSILHGGIYPSFKAMLITARAQTVLVIRHFFPGQVDSSGRAQNGIEIHPEHRSEKGFFY